MQFIVVDLCGVNVGPESNDEARYSLVQAGEDLKHPGEPAGAFDLVSQVLSRLESGGHGDKIRSGSIRVEMIIPSDTFAMAMLIVEFHRLYGVDLWVTFPHVFGKGRTDHRWKESRRRIWFPHPANRVVCGVPILRRYVEG